MNVIPSVAVRPKRNDVKSLDVAALISKYFGETLVTITETGDVVDSEITSAPLVSPLKGRLLASAADIAPGRDDARSTRSARSASRRDGV